MKPRLKKLVGRFTGRVLGSFVGGDNFQQLHLVHGRKVVHANDFLGPCADRGNVGDGEGGGVGGEDAVVLGGPFRVPQHLVLHLDILKHRFDHNVRVLQVFVREGRVEVGQDLLAFKAERTQAVRKGKFIQAILDISHYNDEQRKRKAM